MTARVHMALAFGAALAIHGGAFALWAPSGAQGGAGAGGSAPVSVSASASAAALVATWEVPPEALDQGVAKIDAPMETDAPRAQSAREQMRPVVTPVQALTSIALDVTPAALPDAPTRLAAPMAMVASGWVMPDEVAESLSDKNSSLPSEVDLARTAPAPIARPRVAVAPAIAKEPPVAVLRPTGEDPRPKPRPLPSAEARPATVAAGAGAVSRAGRNAVQTATPDANRAKASLMARWGAEIRNRVERRKSYPAAAAGASGKTVLQLSVTAGGRLAGVGVLKSSGVAAIDRAAVGAVRRAGRFPSAPEGLDAGPHAFRLSLTFRG